MSQSFDPSKITQTTAEEFERVVKTRRSCRFFVDEPIPEEVVHKCLDLALLAPNSSNLQTWKFHWIKNVEKMKSLTEACFSQPAASTARELIVITASRTAWRSQAKRMHEMLSEPTKKTPKGALNYYAKLIPSLYSMGPMGVLGPLRKIAYFFLGLFKVTPREPTSLKDMEKVAVKSAALACQNLMLAFSSYGYDSCPMEGYDSKRVRNLLDLEPGRETVMILGVGKRDPKGIYGPRFRFPREEFIDIV